jgi:hypothetical protein
MDTRRCTDNEGLYRVMLCNGHTETTPQDITIGDKINLCL